ncbi:MAG: hypothetical protein KDC80_29380 [Saprospiraceae bacterium]|nr:hypothetical protein [Saprospiraceae bacterium]
MISSETLTYIIAIGFGLMGLLHFIFPRIMMKYSIEADLLNADVAVKMSGALLIAASIMLFTDKYWDYAFYGLSGFLLVSSIIMHRFWVKNTGVEQLSELLHFVKNLILAALLWYLKDRLKRP